MSVIVSSGWGRGRMTAPKMMFAPGSTAAPIALAASLPYLPAVDDYFVNDDFGVVSLLSEKPASAFFGWFTRTWMDDIWGSTPDELRPFPAVTYQLTSLWGAGSPIANHLLNIAFHVANALLVYAVAVTAAGLPVPAATWAALAFALLPSQAETVAWVTGRVDSMPAAFYTAAFLAYVVWRAPTRSTGAHRFYLASIALYFVALFTKQNTDRPELIKIPDGTAPEGRFLVDPASGRVVYLVDPTIGGVAPGSVFASIDPTTGGGLLADNGGPTQTIAILPGGLAAGAADPATATPTDQRGVARDADPDLGAYEAPFRVEAESLTLVSGFKVENLAVGSGGKVIKSPNAATLVARDLKSPISGTEKVMF